MFQMKTYHLKRRNTVEAAKIQTQKCHEEKRHNMVRNKSARGQTAMRNDLKKKMIAAR